MPEDSKEAEHQDGSPQPDDVAPDGDESARVDLGDAEALDDADLAPDDDVEVSVTAEASDASLDDVEVAADSPVADVAVAAGAPVSDDASVTDDAPVADDAAVTADAPVTDGGAVTADGALLGAASADEDDAGAADAASLATTEAHAALRAAATLTHSGASQLPPAPIETIEAVAAAVGRLRAEVAATTDRARQARLLDEAAEIQERGGDEPGAARDYLAAYNADTSFREPLEGLVRLLERRRSLSNLGKLIEALVASAATPEERARALTQRALFVEDVQKDLEGARGMAREATETGAIAADLGPAWLALEMVAAKLGDAAEREEALAGRAELTDDPTWRGLLLVDVARLAASGGDVDRALDVLARARDVGGSAAFHAAATVERVVAADPGLPGSDDARARSRALAEALEARAEMIQDALGNAEAGDARGVPRYCRRVEYVIDLLLRAADARRLASELGRASQLLDRALAVLAEAAERDGPPDEPTANGESARDARSTIERIVLTARLRLAELAGDTALAADLADKRIVGETDGGVAASLAMRVAEHAASEGDVPRALEALTRATERDPASSPARALKIDILEGSGDGARFATELEELSRHCATGEAQGRALLLAAYVWATRAESGARAREALGQAAACGVPKETIARLGRTLASLRSDHTWYEDATRALVEHASATGAESDAAKAGDAAKGASDAAAELPLLWIELARIRLGQGDDAGAAKATAALRELPEGAWLGRVLDGLASPDIEPARARTALEELAAGVDDPALRRSLGVVCALRARAAGDEAAAVAHLEALAKDDAADPLVNAYLGDLLRLASDRASAARHASAAAEAVAAAGDDPERAAARHLEAGLETWRLGERGTALAHFDAAAEAAPEAARPALAWATRGIDVDAVDGRRRALDVAGGDAGVALERFALEATLGDPDEAASALAAVDIASSPSLRVAGALARLAWPRGGATDAEAVIAALDTVAGLSDPAKSAAAAERLRLAREDGDSDADGIAAAAKAWLDAGGGGAAAVEWLASAMASGAPHKEIPARRALAELASDEAREALHASATLLAWALAPDEAHALVSGTSHAARLANLELSPPGCDPRRRASTLSELDGALGEDTENDAMGLAGWSALAAGDAAAALDVFRAVTTSRPDDLHAWEGMRTCAEELGDAEAYAVACEQLGARCADDARGAAFWERSALAWLKLGTAFETRAESALDASFARDATRPVAFDRLFRRVRERKDHDKLLALIERRLEVTDDAPEIAKLYWEQARVLREKGDPDGALEALEHVTTFDDNHVGALALTGEIFIRRGMFEEAAEKLARLAGVEAAPPKNRVTAGVAAVDLYENKLGRHDLALEVLVALHQARLTTLPVRERLARAAARTGAWAEATTILAELMHERPEREGRIEAARLAMAIHRDRMMSPTSAIAAATKLLDEAPTDGEAIDLIVGLDPALRERRPLLERGRDALLMSLHELPSNLESQRRLARVAHALGDNALEQAALSCAVALGGPDGSSEQMIALYSSKKPRVPQVTLSEPMLRQILASGDDGPIADLFVALGPTLGEALGPTRESLGVTKKDRVDPKAGIALRAEIAQWAAALGIATFDLYVGGKDPGGVQGIAGDTPAIVVGSGVNAPLSPTTRARVARELVSIARGTTITRWRDDATIAAIVVAACNLAKVRVDAPPFAVLAEVERHIGKAISRKTKAAIEPICRAYVAASPDARQWAARARISQARCAALASGDVSVVLADVFGEPVERLGAVARDDLRAHELFRFVLSRPYFELRRSLGLEGQG
ncbi:MAG: tetratricopeptide repeat protein [Labilithrix sp.]|nr:tetratricopeptide repeat protein [Labilithrix sp.]